MSYQNKPLINKEKILVEQKYLLEKQINILVDQIKKIEEIGSKFNDKPESYQFKCKEQDEFKKLIFDITNQIEKHHKGITKSINAFIKDDATKRKIDCFLDGEQK